MLEEQSNWQSCLQNCGFCLPQVYEMCKHSLSSIGGIYKYTAMNPKCMPMQCRKLTIISWVMVYVTTPVHIDWCMGININPYWQWRSKAESAKLWMNLKACIGKSQLESCTWVWNWCISLDWIYCLAVCCEQKISWMILTIQVLLLMSVLCYRNNPNSKHLSIGRKKFNMDPKKVILPMSLVRSVADCEYNFMPLCLTVTKMFLLFSVVTVLKIS